MSSRHDRRVSEERSRLINEGSIGTHITNDTRRASHTRVNFGSTRGARRANRGEINHVTPQTRTRESAAAYSRRSRTRDYVDQNIRRRRRRRIVRILVAVIAIVAVIAAVVAFTFAQSVDRQMSLNDKDATAALTQTSNATDPYYLLVAGEFYEKGRAYNGPEMLVLMRVDPQNKQVTYVSVPSNMEASLSDGNTHPISYAQVLGGDAELISQVSSAMGVPIAHYLKVNKASLSSLVDSIGGVDVNLPEVVDDPRAGTLYLDSGDQTLDGNAAVEAVRASNYSNPVVVRSQVQASVLQAVFGKVASQGGLSSVSTFDTIASDFKTDLTYNQLSDLIEPFTSGSPTVYTTSVPGKTSTDANGQTVFDASQTNLTTLMQAVGSGSDPNAAQEAADASVDAAQYTVTVRNGGGVAGAGAAAVSMLQAAGYQVPEAASNTDTQVYDDTLVIYNSADQKAVADDIVKTLGQGRASDASVYYSYDTDILVIVGKNWVSS